MLELYVLSIQGFLGRNCDLEDFHWSCFDGKRRDVISVSSKRKPKTNKIATKTSHNNKSRERAIKIHNELIQVGCIGMCGIHNQNKELFIDDNQRREILHDIACKHSVSLEPIESFLSQISSDGGGLQWTENQMKKKIKEGMRKLTRKEFWEALIHAGALYGITPDLDGSVIIISQDDDSLKELKETEKINPLEFKMDISAQKVFSTNPNSSAVGHN